MRGAFAAIAACCLLVVAAPHVLAHDAPPPPPGPVGPSVADSPSPDPEVSAIPPVEASPATPTPVPTPTQPPILVDPPQPVVELGRTLVARINSALGNVAATVADPSIVSVAVDQQQRTLAITARAIGTTTIAVSDDRGVTREVTVRVAYAAGVIPAEVPLRVTGDPVTAAFLRQAIADAVGRAATLRPGARAVVYTGTIALHGDVKLDDRVDVGVQLQLQGDGLLSVEGTTTVHVENFAVPRVRPSRLLVSDYPERLTADGLLFASDIDTSAAQRFLYYHFNPSTEPPRRILVKITNPGEVAATLHVLQSLAGPGTNELEVGHAATKTFLVRERQNEGVVLTVPPHATVNLVNHDLPPGTLVTGIFQMREVAGVPLQLAIVAQPADAPSDRPVDPSTLLSGGTLHARGVYTVPEFYADYTYDTEGADLEIPVGILPLPNLREGQALAGDYGVKQTARIVLVNPSREPREVALYANPRGGGATGTFLIDNTLVQAHRLPPFSKYKLWQETLAPGTYRRLHVVTMPEGGSSYPLRLILAPDDGSVAPGAPASPIY